MYKSTLFMQKRLFFHLPTSEIAIAKNTTEVMTVFRMVTRSNSTHTCKKFSITINERQFNDDGNVRNDDGVYIAVDA